LKVGQLHGLAWRECLANVADQQPLASQCANF
jgi:hypothetical protein